MKKRLYKSRTDKVIEGVCGGIADYINMDPTVVRVLYVVLSVMSSGFPGILIYILLAIIMPNKPEEIE
jgi:phage shock protein C